MSTNQILFGLGLVLTLAVGSQLVARSLRIPALVLLLPVGFVAGIATDDVHPDELLGALYQPFVSIAVGIILFEAGLRLSFGEVRPGIRKAVVRLVLAGGLITWLAVAATVAVLYDGIDRSVAVLIGAILVVSGPTVVLPLLAFIRPTRDVRSLLKWEGTLIDPVGALLGVLVFQSVSSGKGWQPGEMLLALGIGALVGLVGAPALLLLLREVQRSAPRMIVPATLMVVVAAVVAADLLNDDAGLMTAVLMGIAVGNQRRIDISLSLFEFQETLVQLLIGVLFVLVAASVSPQDVRSVMPEALVLLAVMILLIRPASVALATLRSPLAWPERAFVAWMAPRGIVAGATASAFGPKLAQEGIAGADKVLPIVFIAIFSTVVIYGLTASPGARILGVAGSGGTQVLIVGGHAWAREIAEALERSGVAVRMWVGPADHRTAAQGAGLHADRGRIMVDAVSREAELEEVTDALFLTESDDFNTLGAADLRDELGHEHVFRIAPHPEEPHLVPPSREAGILGDRSLTFEELDRQFAAGARIVTRTPETTGAGRTDTPLFVVRSGGRLSVLADGHAPDTRAGDTLIVLAAEREGAPDPAAPAAGDPVGVDRTRG
ncbi:MAG TPA: sodium:proton antiporter [Gaiellaceae bacterium]|nr:sodium:proton antiporter [Gaiellaceae bacterium]